jgi:hypothetical protein
MGKKYYIRREEIQIVFKSDPELKGKALEKARQEGVTLKAVLCMAMKAYVNDELVMGVWQNIERYENTTDDEGSPPKALRKGGVEKKQTRIYPVVRHRKKESN